MVESGPWTPGQVSFLLAFAPIFTAWVYSEILEYKKSSSLSKVHSDSNLVDLGNEATKEDDRAVLLEGGLAKPVASVKFQNGSVRANLARFLRWDEIFLLENRALLRAMSEFGAILIYFYLCDRTNLFAESKKYLPKTLRLTYEEGIQMLKASIEMLIRSSRVGKATSYGELMCDAFGKIGRVLLQICVIVNNIGVMTVYMIIIGPLHSNGQLILLRVPNPSPF